MLHAEAARVGFHAFAVAWTTCFGARGWASPVDMDAFVSSRNDRCDLGGLGPVWSAELELDADAPVGLVRDAERDLLDTLCEGVDRSHWASRCA